MARTPASKPTAIRQDADPVKTAEPGHTASGDADGKAYVVGYGRPPLANRFKPGQSGNPKGREKNSRNMRTTMQQVLNEDMQIREGDRLRRMPAFEALVRTTLNRAFRGDPKAMASLLVLVRHCGYGTDRDEPATELLSGVDAEAIINDYIERRKPTAAKEVPGAEPSAPPPTPPKKPRRHDALAQPSSRRRRGGGGDHRQRPLFLCAGLVPDCFGR
jgi:hypothetical protein